MKIKVCNFYPVLISAVMCLTFINQAVADYQSEVLADSPLVYLRLQGDSMNDGDVATDLGSAGVTTTYRVSGTSTFDVVWGPGSTGPAVYFNQTGNGKVYAAIHDPAEDLSYADITVEAWYRVQPEDLEDYMRLFQTGGDWLAMGAPGLTIGSITTEGQWHHVVVTYDSTGSGVTKELFVDGSYIGTASGPNDLHFDQYDYWMIGCEGNTGWQGDLFHGDLDEFAIYEGILSPDRIKVHSELFLDPPPPPPYHGGAYGVMGGDSTDYIPEPTTVLLFGLGGLALIRKRRV